MGLIPGIVSCLFSACTAMFGLWCLSRCAELVGKKPGDEGRKASFNEVARLAFGKGWVMRLFDVSGDGGGEPWNADESGTLERWRLAPAGPAMAGRAIALPSRVASRRDMRGNIAHTSSPSPSSASACPCRTLSSAR
jgi:hypothetical protein